MLQLILEFVLFLHLLVFCSWASYKLLYTSPAPNYFEVRTSGGLTYRQILNISSTVADYSFDCSICLEEVEAGEIVKVLPGCFHMFHTRCIEPWLLQSSQCPYCRSNIVPILG